LTTSGFIKITFKIQNKEAANRPMVWFASTPICWNGFLNADHGLISGFQETSTKTK
jgi:hypothetical protein